MLWWLWVSIGLALLIVEVFVPSDFFVFFFGIAAILVGGFAATGIATTAWAQCVLFSVFAVLSVLFLRKPLSRRWGTTSTRREDELVGEVARLSEDLRPGDVGKAELRGTVWSVRSRHGEMIEKGRRCRVERVEGLTLWVVPEMPPAAS
ncbi:MAG: NfeD family protein [Deltaproteobacteria bacterium]|nr:NfeD family protein [Deltaproteobacteria bacterium]